MPIGEFIQGKPGVWYHRGQFHLCFDLKAMYEMIADLKRLSRLSRDARRRLKWMDFYYKTNNASLTCRHFHISTRTFYLWKRRYDPYNLLSLESRSRRPKKLRSPTPPEMRLLIYQLRRAHPTYGPKTIQLILRRDHNITIADRTIYRFLKRRGLIKPYRKRRKIVRVRKRVTYTIPGANVQIDTKHLRTNWGKTYYQFTAVDEATRITVAKIYPRARQQEACRFLRHCRRTFSFKIHQVQTDNGSEYQSVFRAECTKWNINNIYTNKDSPEQNGKVERFHRTVQDDYYHQGVPWSKLSALNEGLKRFLREYHSYRPHQALGGLTPREYYQKHYLCSSKT
jgi:transposase InsO family protein